MPKNGSGMNEGVYRQAGWQRHWSRVEGKDVPRAEGEQSDGLISETAVGELYSR